jgi:hypothetical protein
MQTTLQRVEQVKKKSTPPLTNQKGKIHPKKKKWEKVFH